MASIEETEQQFIDDFISLDDWFLQYEMLLEMAGDTKGVPEWYRTSENRVPGCQSGAWLMLSSDNGIIHVSAYSEALIIRGILATLVSFVDGHTAAEVASYSPRFIVETSLKDQLSTDRFDGIGSIISQIREFAADQAAHPIG